MIGPEMTALRAVVESTIESPEIESAAAFVVPAGSTQLELAAAAGIDGIALERLAEAVRNPQHPIARTMADASASFDVTPTAPGGPALRSHVPLFVGGGVRRRVAGVLAVAHDRPLNRASRERLEALADRAASTIPAA
jgi:hypothetical protein